MNISDGFFLTAGCAEVQRDAIISEFEPPVSFKKGEVIYSSDGFRHAIGLIVKGTARASADNDDGLVLRRFSVGDCFGVAAVFGNNGSYVSTVIAESDCEIRFADEETLRRIFADYPDTAINFIRFLSDRVRFLNSKISVISCSATADKLLKLLRVNADESGVALIPKSMTLVAKMLGISRASLYRAFDELENKGYIIKNKNGYTVIDDEKII